ncbi:FAD-dependent monooxygenase [Serratia rubidaea]|uniref:FAD-dependent monooxygenase n=2 Tax=Serratia rubidaea TaxID=61652 RepID=UPI0022B91EAB|nr:FAD-dependent monooxygenase [Serratia rubidaea]WBF47349.1 FAD-dependent monooxygenase [Serratia rubidaea]
MEKQPLPHAEHPQVLIVGAGPVGLTLAILLKQYGVPLRIIEKNAGPSTSTKAMAIHSRTLEVFRELGIADRAVAQGFAIKAFSIQANQRRIINYNFSLLEAAWPMLLSLPQPDAEKLMLQRLEALGVNVEWNTTLNDIRQEADGASALLQQGDGEEQWVSCRWLCACDGARSTVRKKLNLSFDGSAYDSYFMLADADIEWDQRRDEGAFFLGAAEGYVAIAPIDGKGRYRLFFEMPHALPPEGERPQLDLATFQSLCDGRGQQMTLSNLSSTTLAAFQHRQVTQLRHGAIFLLGDAAHIGSPIGGQWMNLGLSEAYNLGWKLAWVARGYAGPQLLDSYHEERYPVAQEAEKTAHRLTKLITTRKRPLVWLRNNLLPLISGRSKVQRKLPSLISGHHYHYCGSRWVLNELKKGERNSWRKKAAQRALPVAAPRAGQLAPDVMLWAAPGTQAQPLSELFRQRYLLLIFTAAEGDSALVAGWQAMAQALVAGYQGIAARCVADALSADEHDGEPRLIADPDWRLHRRYHADAGCLVLIRPDGYIAFLGKDADALSDFLQTTAALRQQHDAAVSDLLDDVAA